MFDVVWARLEMNDAGSTLDHEYVCRIRGSGCPHFNGETRHGRQEKAEPRKSMRQSVNRGRRGHSTYFLVAHWALQCSISCACMRASCLWSRFACRPSELLL